MAIPKYDELFNPLLEALHELGGSATVTEMEEKVAHNLQLSDKEINEIHSGNRTVLGYRLAWSRNYLKRYGLFENSARGIWSLTNKGFNTKKVDKNIVNKFVKSLDSKNRHVNHDPEIDKSLHENAWQEELLKKLRNVSPSEFEIICQRVLRESGFIQVNVTGRSGDGGIDGTGVLRIGGFLSFKVIFQCKRYQGSVSSKLIREFKGTMAGRAEKGIFITTGTFTKEAKSEASRDGSIPIDLVDGEQLINIMKDLNLGVKIKTEEVVTFDQDWFHQS